MRTLIVALLLVTVSTAFAQDFDPKDGPIITFTEKAFDFGDITQGETVEHVFVFKNTGKKPLILTNVQTTCGCTAPVWPREPIAPGKTGEIKIRFNSTGKIGLQNKPITILSNAQNDREVITIKTNVTASGSN
jgi:hypothetical protein